MRKKKYDKAFKVMICKEYGETDVSYRELQEEYGCHPTSMVKWIKQYREYGEDAFEDDENASETPTQSKRMGRLEALEQEVALLKEEIKELKEQAREIDKAIFDDFDEEDEEEEERKEVVEDVG